MCTPALPKPSPANVAAIAIASRALTSEPSRTAAGSAHESSCNDLSANMSARGLEPQYGTRSSGRLRANDVYGLAV